MSIRIRLQGGAAAVAGAATWLLIVEQLGRLAADQGFLARRPLVLAALWAAHAACVAAMGMAFLTIAIAARAGARRRGLAGGLAAAALALWPGLLVGASLASGDWISRQKWAPLVRWGAPAVVVGAAFAAGLLVLRPGGRRPPAPLWAALAAAAMLGDALILPGLYPAAHLFLYGLAAASSLLCFMAWLDRGEPTSRARTAIAGGAAVALASGAAVLATLGDAARAALFSTSPAVGNLVAAAWPTARGRFLLRELEQLPDAGPPAEAPARGRLAAPARSAVLIVVDTLRADALPPARSQETPFASDGDTPRLDEWLSSAYRFRHAYSQASRTQRSMPPMFRSLEPFEDPSTTGVALPEAMRRAGLLPVAVVPEYFLIPAAARSQELLHGFERVAIYEKDHQESLVPQALRMLEEVSGQPFFAWIHFYNMHDPYFAGRLLGGGASRGGAEAVSGDGSPPERYRAALRWLDAELGALLSGMDRLGLSSTTAIILAADHGEHLGEGRRRGHGDGVHEEEVHVPLALRIPGSPGAVVEGLAGNIDIVPTLLELLGQPPDPRHRGASLVPLLLDPGRASGRIYYSQNADGSIHGVIDERSKLVYDEPRRVLSRHDRLRDPRDRESVLGEDPEADRRLISALTRRNPGLFAAELTDPEARAALEGRLAAVDPSHPPEHLGFLLELAASSPAPAARAAAERIFAGAEDAGVRAAVIDHLYASDPTRWSRLLEQALARAAGAPEEVALVSALGERGQPAFGHRLVARRLDAVAADPRAPVARAWLRLTERWPKPRALFTVPLLHMITAALAPQSDGTSPDAELLIIALDNAAALERGGAAAGEAEAALEAAVLPLAGHANVRVATAACRALAPVGAAPTRAAVLAILGDRGRDARVRQAALNTLVALDGADAVSVILREAEDPLLAVDAIQLLKRLRDARGLPFLTRIAQDHHSAWTRRQAKQAIDAIRGSTE